MSELIVVAASVLTALVLAMMLSEWLVRRKRAAAPDEPEA
jgi:hypothetical protein